MGRCLIRIQQYEHLAKAIAAHADLAGPAAQLADIQTKRIEKASTASLGTLVKGEKTAFTTLRTLFTAETDEADSRDENTLPEDQPSFATRFRVQMTEERRTETIRELDEFVALRNRLVHHFMDDFDIFSEAGCTTALQHLVDSYTQIDRHFVSLEAHTQSLDNARRTMAAFMKTPEFRQLLSDGIEEIPKVIRL